jgi:hypothetical protein
MEKKMQINLLIAFKWGVIIALFIAAIFVAFVFISSIDSKYTKGRHYGVEIGMTKKEVYDELPEIYNSLTGSQINSNMEMELYSKEIKMPDRINNNVNEEKFEYFQQKFKWKIYVDSNYFFDNFTLTFCNSRLCEVRRYRLFIELP